MPPFIVTIPRFFLVFRIVAVLAETQAGTQLSLETPSLQLTTAEAAMGCTPEPFSECRVATYRGFNSEKGCCFGAYPNLTELKVAGTGFNCPNLPSDGGTCIGTACNGGHCATSWGYFAADHASSSGMDWQQFTVLGVPDPTGCGYTLFRNKSVTYALIGSQCKSCWTKSSGELCARNYIPRQTCYIEKYTRVSATALRWKMINFTYTPDNQLSRHVKEVLALPSGLTGKVIKTMRCDPIVFPNVSSPYTHKRASRSMINVATCESAQQRDLSSA